MPDLPALVGLSLLPVRTWRLINEQLRRGDAPSTVLDRALRERYPDRPAARQAIRSRSAAAIARAGAAGIVPIAWSDASYPVALAAIDDPPPVLWTRGMSETLDRAGVAIVGSRAATPYALAVAHRLAADVAARGLAVVSGLARGVDAAAHRGALSVSGRTIAIVGSGVDVVYPPEHAPLAGEIGKAGAIVSELVPGTPPRPAFFPRRNRIISGLSRGVVVIEAGERSGALITARCALEQGRSVMAVPGNVLSGRNRGGHGLLRDGAKIVETADDILEELDLPGRATGSDPACVSGGPIDPVLACLTPGEPADLDALAERSGLTPARLLPRLFELEIQGLIGRAGAGRFVRFDRTC